MNCTGVNCPDTVKNDGESRFVENGPDNEKMRKDDLFCFSPVTGKEIEVELMLGGVDKDSNGDVISAEAMTISYFMATENVREPPVSFLRL